MTLETKSFPPSFLILQKKFLRSCPHRPYSCKIVRDFVLSVYRITHLEIAELIHLEHLNPPTSDSLLNARLVSDGWSGLWPILRINDLQSLILTDRRRFLTTPRSTIALQTNLKNKKNK